jgi:hypothetical protein
MLATALAALPARATNADGSGALAATLLVDQGPNAEAHAAARVPLVLAACDAHLCAEADSPDGAVHARLGVGDEISVEVEWRQRAWVRRIAVELAFAGARATAIGRDLRPIEAPLVRAGRFDPKWVTLSDGTTLVVDDQVDGVVVERTPRGTTVRVELEAAEARPFTRDARCTRNWHDPNRRLTLPARLKLPGERAAAHMVRLAGAPTPLVKSHFPDGRRAALVITDHADQSTLRTLTALAYGRSDDDHARGGLIGHHLAITKALFAHGVERPQLEDPKVVALADALHEAGSEIVPHSATPRPDPRPVTDEALARFTRWAARTWIDHQPETNCEAFGDQGFVAGGRFGIADLLSAHGYQYVWAEDDLPAGDLNLLDPQHPAARAPTVWPIGRLSEGGPDGLWMFRTEWAFVEATNFYALYRPAALDRLERERGLHIAHTYLETYHPERTRFGLRTLLVPVNARRPRGAPGPVMLDPRLEALFAALEARVARGSLWVPTLGELADRLRASAAVKLRPVGDGRFVLYAPAPLKGATFVVERPGARVTLDGRAPRGLRTEGDQTVFWDDLPAGETRVELR